MSISGKSDELPELKDIQILMHIQTAKGAFKMGMYDSTDSYLKLVNRKNVSNDMRIMVPIIKLKTEQSKSDLRNMDYATRKGHIEKIYGHLKRKMEANRHMLGSNVDCQIDATGAPDSMDHLSSSPSLESIKTVIKSNLMKYKL